MSMDLRIPMGLMFSLIGIILAAFGLATRSDTALYERSLGINVNLWWGVVLLIFGQVIFQMGRRTLKQQVDSPPPRQNKVLAAGRKRRKQ